MSIGCWFRSLCQFMEPKCTVRKRVQMNYQPTQKESIKQIEKKTHANTHTQVRERKKQSPDQQIRREKGSFRLANHLFPQSTHQHDESTFTRNLVVNRFCFPFPSLIATSVYRIAKKKDHHCYLVRENHLL